MICKSKWPLLFLITSLTVACSPRADVRICMEHVPYAVRPCERSSSWWTQAVFDDSGKRTGTRLMKVARNSVEYEMGFRTADVIKQINDSTVEEIYAPCPRKSKDSEIACHSAELEALKGGVEYDEDERYIEVIVERSGDLKQVVYEVYSREKVSK